MFLLDYLDSCSNVGHNTSIAKTASMEQLFGMYTDSVHPIVFELAWGRKKVNSNCNFMLSLLNFEIEVGDSNCVCQMRFLVVTKSEISIRK